MPIIIAFPFTLKLRNGGCFSNKSVLANDREIDGRPAETHVSELIPPTLLDNWLRNETKRLKALLRSVRALIGCV